MAPGDTKNRVQEPTAPRGTMTRASRRLFRHTTTSIAVSNLRSLDSVLLKERSLTSGLPSFTPTVTKGPPGAMVDAGLSGCSEEQPSGVLSVVL